MFDLDIYPEHCIRQAIADYNDLAEIKLIIEGKDNLVKCQVISSVYSLEKTIKDFTNYVLSLAIGK